jgi:hypothetical protein
VGGDFFLRRRKMTKLQYLGARDLKFTDPRFGREYDFTTPDKTCEVEDGHAKTILLESPKGFKVVNKTLELVIDPDKPPVPVEEDDEQDDEQDDQAKPELKINV